MRRNDSTIEEIYNFTSYFFHTFNGVPNPSMKVMLAIGYNDSNVAYLRNRYKLFINMNALLSEYAGVTDTTKFVELTKTYAMHVILHELSHVEQSFKQGMKQRESAANMKVADFMIKNYDKVSDLVNFYSDKDYWVNLRNNTMRASVYNEELEYIRVAMDELLPVVAIMQHPVATRLMIESENNFINSVTVVDELTNQRYILTPSNYKGAEDVNRIMYENKLSVGMTHDYKGNYLIRLGRVEERILPMFRNNIGKYTESQRRELSSM